MYLSLIFITIVFFLILFNVINNKKISLISSLIFLVNIVIYIIYYFYNEKFLVLEEKYQNFKMYYLIFCFLNFIIAFIEYFISFKMTSDNKKEEIMEEIKKVELKSENHTNKLLVYLEMMDEPLACMFDEQYLINNQMKKILKYNSCIIEKNKFYSFINPEDKNNFFKNEKICLFRLNINNYNEWFDKKTILLNDNEYQLIRLSRNTNNLLKLKLNTFKELNNSVKNLINENKDYYLVFFDITNTKEITSFYGKDFTDLVISKHLNIIYNLPYFFQIKIYYISLTEYVILLEDLVEYNILLSELENNTSLILKNEIYISDNKIQLKAKVGTISSKDVNDNNAYATINKGFETLKLACSEGYPGDFAIYHETDDDMNFNLKDFNIDLDIDLKQYKARLK